MVSEQRTRNESAEFRRWGPERVRFLHGENEEGGWGGGGWPPATSRLTSGADVKLCCFLLFVFLFRFLFFSFAACYCHFLSFVLSSSPVGITIECKQIVPFSSLESLLSALW